MKTLLVKLTTLFFLLLFTISCSVNKRHYLPGYDISLKQYRNDQSNLQKKTKDISINKNIDNNIQQSDFSDDLFASNDKKLSSNFLIKKSDLKSTNVLLSVEDDCDNIIMRNGDEIKCKVIEVGTTEIKYKKCDNLNGPIYSINKTEVLMIRYINGSKDIIKLNEQSQTSATNIVDSSKAENHPLAAAALICSLVGWVVFGIGLLLGIIFGAIALNKIDKNPSKFKGRGMALAGLIIGLISIVILLMVVLIL